MKPRREFSYEQAVMLLAVVIPLALAEGVWWYLAAVVAAVMVGWWCRTMDRKPPLGAMSSRIFVLLGFGFLLYEYFNAGAIPVLALSHFMTLVCVSKFLQERSLRDDAQLAVLSLLLLVVSAIVSGNVIFLVVLLVSLTAGLEMLIRFNLTLERSYVDQINRLVQPAGGPPAFAVATSRRAVPRYTTVTIAMFSTLAGILVFAFFPRFGAGMFGRMETRPGGLTTTGFSKDITFDSIGPINESDLQIMRVKVESNHGTLLDGEPIYFRGRTYETYSNRTSRSWEWQRGRRSTSIRRLGIDESTGRNDLIPLLPELGPLDDLPLFIERYQIEPNAAIDYTMFGQYPPVALTGIDTAEIETADKLTSDQTLRVGRTVRRPLRYTLYTPMSMTPALVAALKIERRDARLLEERGFGEGPTFWGPSEPIAYPPNELPRADDIRALVQRLKETAGPPDGPEYRRRFAEAAVAYLTSNEFSYTLSPPSLARSTEPIGAFLLDTRKGYCQHFASAMVIMCQFAGIPARLVSGFRCDDFNRMGRFYSVRGQHAHAWVEVFIPERDWVRFDPTPASDGEHGTTAGWLKKLRSYSDFFQFQWATLVVSYDSDARRQLLAGFKDWLARPARKEGSLLGMVWAFVEELFTWRVVMGWHDRLLYWVFALLILALAILIGYVIAVLSRRAIGQLLEFQAGRWPGNRPLGDAGLYHRLCRRLARLGLRRRPGQTSAEFAADLAARFPMLELAPALVDAHYEVTYGKRSLSPDRRRTFEDFLHRLQSVDETGLQQTL